LDEFKKRFPSLYIAYIVLDAGYDSEEIYKGIYEGFKIIPIIIRDMVYPKGFNSKGKPLCEFGYPFTKTGLIIKENVRDTIVKKSVKRYSGHFPMLLC